MECEKSGEGRGDLEATPMLSKRRVVYCTKHKLSLEYALELMLEFPS